jgi:hypothetical protein
VVKQIKGFILDKLGMAKPRRRKKKSNALLEDRIKGFSGRRPVHVDVHSNKTKPNQITKDIQGGIDHGSKNDRGK